MKRNRFKIERINGIRGDYAVVDTKNGARVIVLPCRDVAASWCRNFNADARNGATSVTTLSADYPL